MLGYDRASRASSMAMRTGKFAVKQKMARRPLTEPKILVMSQHDATVLTRRALEAEAHGCLDKSRLSTDLLSAIAALLEGPNPSSTKAPA